MTLTYMKLENLRPKKILLTRELTKLELMFLKKGMRYQSEISSNMGFKKSAPSR